jgi:hypothetical protein
MGANDAGVISDRDELSGAKRNPIKVASSGLGMKPTPGVKRISHRRSDEQKTDSEQPWHSDSDLLGE